MPETQRTRTLHSLPCKSHPIYALRRLTLWSSFIGLIMALVSVDFMAILYVCSAFFIWYDLMTWAVEKAKLISTNGRCPNESCPHQRHVNPTDDGGNKDPKWPRKFLLVMDAILAIVLQFGFWIGMGTLTDRYYYRPVEPVIFSAYALLPALISSILHAKAFWKELMARKEEEWCQNRPSKPCAACGYIPPTEVSPESRHTTSPHDGGEDALPRWAQAFNKKSRGRQNDIETGLGGSSIDSEEGVLIAPTPERSDDNTLKGYGTLSQSVQSLNADAEKIVKKKSKRVVGEEWIGKTKNGKSKSKGKGKAKALEEESEDEELGA